MGDLISRDEAIQMYCKAGCGCEPSECGLTYEQDGTEECGVVRFLKSVPSAEPELKKGKWIRNFDGNEWYWFCSNCKEEWYEEDLWMGGNNFPNYCPNCGADMREEEQI